MNKASYIMKIKSAIIVIVFLVTLSKTAPEGVCGQTCEISDIKETPTLHSYNNEELQLIKQAGARLLMSVEKTEVIGGCDKDCTKFDDFESLIKVKMQEGNYPWVKAASIYVSSESVLGFSTNYTFYSLLDGKLTYVQHKKNYDEEFAIGKSCLRAPCRGNITAMYARHIDGNVTEVTFNTSRGCSVKAGKDYGPTFDLKIPAGHQIIAFGGAYTKDRLVQLYAYTIPVLILRPLHKFSGDEVPIEVGVWPPWSAGTCTDYDEYYYANDCKEIYDQGHRANGMYTVFQEDGNAIRVFCEMTIDGGGWTRLLNVNKTVDSSSSALHPIDDLHISYTQVLYVACKNNRFSYQKESWPLWSSKGYNSMLNYLQFDGKQYMVKTPTSFPETPKPVYIELSEFKRMGPVPTICYLNSENSPKYCFYQFIINAKGKLDGFGDRYSALSRDLYDAKFDLDFQIYVR